MDHENSIHFIGYVPNVGAMSAKHFSRFARMVSFDRAIQTELRIRMASESAMTGVWG